MIEYKALVAPTFGGSVGRVDQAFMLDVCVKTDSIAAIKRDIRKQLKQCASDCYIENAPWSDLAVVFVTWKNTLLLLEYKGTYKYIPQGIKEL